MLGLSPNLARHEWVNAFAFEWNRLAEGRCDIEEMLEVGLTLFRVVGDQAPEAIADRHFNSFPEARGQGARSSMRIHHARSRAGHH